MALHILVETLTTCLPYHQSLQQFIKRIKPFGRILRANKAVCFCFLVDGAVPQAGRHRHPLFFNGSGHVKQDAWDVFLNRQLSVTYFRDMSETGVKDNFAAMTSPCARMEERSARDCGAR